MFSTRRKSWKYPKRGDACFMQKNRGLSWEMVDKVETREIILGVSDQGDICGEGAWRGGLWGGGRGSLCRNGRTQAASREDCCG